MLNIAHTWLHDSIVKIPSNIDIKQSFDILLF